MSPGRRGGVVVEVSPEAMSIKTNIYLRRHMGKESNTVHPCGSDVETIIIIWPGTESKVRDLPKLPNYSLGWDSI